VLQAGRIAALSKNQGPGGKTAQGSGRVRKGGIMLIALLIFFTGVAAGLFVAVLWRVAREFNETPEAGV